MLKLKTEKMELRGIKNTQSAKGNLYYIIYCETEEGEPQNFYCKDAKALPEGLKKGDKVHISLIFNNRFKSLEVEQVQKVGA